jgi:glycosyltransferase involved in cell wall biosynthesis
MSLTPFLIKVITRKKVIVTMHNIFEFVDRKGVKENYSLNPITKFFATIATWLYARADKLVMLTKRYEDYIRHRYCADFYHIPHGFMNLDGAEEKSSIYRNYRDGGEGFKIGFFGFFSPYKDPYLILEVYKLLKNKIPGLSLKFVGGPHPNFIESYNRIKNEVFNIGDGIQITGFLPFTDLYRELSDIDLFIFPYRAIGGVSGAVHLVASMGRPFILSDLPDFRYMVYENNMKTVFFNIDDVDDLANKILFLYENPSVMREIVNHNLRIAKDIDIDSVAEEYIKLYTSIV